jgi:hypothetical protein
VSFWTAVERVRSSACISPVKLFSLSGRFRVRRAMPASTVKVMFSKFMDAILRRGSGAGRRTKRLATKAASAYEALAAGLPPVPW